MQRGRAIYPGDCIGITAPASPAELSATWVAVGFLESMGYVVRLGWTALVQKGFLAGSDGLRAAELNAFFADESVAAILCLRGGYGAARLLPALDYELIAQHPKLFIGYSDITALHTALYQRSSLITVHGPVAVQLPDAAGYTKSVFCAGLRGALGGEVKLPPENTLVPFIAGRAQGRLVGGNLAVLASLVGTPYELDASGCILFLEETGEALYRIDRLLNQLWQSGLLGRISGLIFGDFTDCNGGAGCCTDEVIRYYANLCAKPTAFGLPVGHGRYNMFLPFGVMTILDCTSETASLQIAEEYIIR